MYDCDGCGQPCGCDALVTRRSVYGDTNQCAVCMANVDAESCQSCRMRAGLVLGDEEC